MEDTSDPSSTTLDGTHSWYRSKATEIEKSAGSAESTDAVSRTASAVSRTTSAVSRTISAVSQGARRVGRASGTLSRSDRVGVGGFAPVSRLGRSLGVFASGSPLIATVAAVETLIATLLLGLPLTPAPAVVALVAFAVYTADHVADADADARSTPGRAALARRYADQLMIAATLAYGLAVALALLGGPVALAITLVPGAFWILYASDWLPNAGRFLFGTGNDGASAGWYSAIGRRVPRLKDVVIVNSAVVALAWAVAVTALPVAFANAGADPVSGAGALAAFVDGGPIVAVAFAYFFLRSFVDTELPNVRDVEADAAVGVATLPVVIGVAGTRRVLYGADVGTAAVVTVAAASGVLAWSLAAALIAGIGMSIGITALAGRIEDRSALGIAPDCTYLVVGALLAVVHLIG